MIKKTITRILFGFISGLFFAIFMWALDHYNHEEFNILKFLFHFVAFGLFQGLVSGFYFMNNNKK